VEKEKARRMSGLEWGKSPANEGIAGKKVQGLGRQRAAMESEEERGEGLEISPTPLGFSVPRLLIGEGASSGGSQGLLTPGWRGQGLGHATYV
jgi:hypothetical protein